MTHEEKLARRRIRAAKWREANRDRIRDYDRAYMAVPEHRDARDAAGRRFQGRQRAKAKPKRQRLCFGRHPGKKKDAGRRYREANREAINMAIARAKAAKPDLYRDHATQTQAKRRARKRASVVERVSLRRIYARDAMRCHLCGSDVATAERSIDHLIPVSRGGAHAEWNLMVAHLACNKRRGVRRLLPVEDRASAEAYIVAKNGDVMRASAVLLNA